MFGFYVPLESFALVWRRPLPVKGNDNTNFDLCSARATFYNRKICGSVSLIHVAERFAAVSICVYDVILSGMGLKHSTYGMREKHINRLRHRGGKRNMKISREEDSVPKKPWHVDFNSISGFSGTPGQNCCFDFDNFKC